MPQVVGHQPVIVETWVQSQASPCRISDRQKGTGTGFTQAVGLQMIIRLGCGGLHACIIVKQMLNS